MLRSAFKTYTELQRSRLFPTAKQDDNVKRAEEDMDPNRLDLFLFVIYYAPL